MEDNIERKRLAILRILEQSGVPLSSEDIRTSMEALGYDLSDRTVRFHLLDMDRLEFTRYIGKRGREITEKGREELSKARKIDKVGFLSARIHQMTFAMDFDLEHARGTVPINLSIIEKTNIGKAVPLMKRILRAGYGMGQLLSVFEEGERIGDRIIPEAHVGIGTVCSIALNGIFLKHGIPTDSRFGGLLEIRNGEPIRFVEIINYEGTTIDPLEIFIRSGMTDYDGATANGTGLIGASFREVPAAGRDLVRQISERMKEIGMDAIFRIGLPGQPLLNIPVNEGNIGLIVIGGLNAVGILEEHGISVPSRALSNLVDFGRLVHYESIDSLTEQITR